MVRNRLAEGVPGCQVAAWTMKAQAGPFRHHWTRLVPLELRVKRAVYPVDDREPPCALVLLAVVSLWLLDDTHAHRLALVGLCSGRRAGLISSPRCTPRDTEAQRRRLHRAPSCPFAPVKESPCLLSTIIPSSESLAWAGCRAGSECATCDVQILGG